MNENDQNQFEQELEKQFKANEADLAQIKSNLAQVGGEVKRMVVSLNNMSTAVSNYEREINTHINEIRGWIDTWKTKDENPTG